MKQRISAMVLSTLVLAQTAPLAAQSINPALDRERSETQIAGAITIPLGHSRDRQARAPRLEIVARTRANDGALPIVGHDSESRWQERTIGVTLDGSNRFMLNGQPLTKNDRRDGISTLGAVGIGLGVILALSIAVVADADDAIDDLIDPD